ncbi:hypothetical protein RB595_006839 [Gaeumannomyces hyphopodioides]
MEAVTRVSGGPSASDTDGLGDKRAAIEAWQEAAIATLGPVSDEIQEYWMTIITDDGFESKTLVIRPKPTTHNRPAANIHVDNSPDALDGSKPTPRRPLIVLFHGGGFALGTPAMMTRPGRELAERLGAVVVAPTYRRVPEHAWPGPSRSAWAVLAWLAENAGRELGANLGDGFVVGGFSAGASLAAICAGISLLPAGHDLLAPGGGGFDNRLARPITGVFANCPMLLTEDIVPAEHRDLWRSRVENKDAQGLDSEGVELIWRVMNPDFYSPWTSPFSGWLKSDGNPGDEAASVGIPHYIQVGKLDCLRDDGVVLYEALASRGVETRIDVFEKDGHTGWCALPFESHSKNPTVEEATMAGFSWLLENS